jgi:hypothetical protein
MDFWCPSSKDSLEAQKLLNFPVSRELELGKKPGALFDG